MNFMLDTLGQVSEGQATLLTALLAAVFAALGYVAKLGLETIGAMRDRRNGRLAKLVELDGLLRASRAVFEAQNALARRLAASVQSNQPTLLIRPPASFENIFDAAYAGMDESELRTHGIIRSMTEHALKPLNEDMLHWLKADTYWKAHSHLNGDIGRLGGSLAKLEAHLYMWRAKYAYWMLNPRRTLVYLADEEAQGVEFPHELDQHVMSVLANNN